MADTRGREEVNLLHLVGQFFERHGLRSLRDGGKVVGVHHVRTARRGEKRRIDVQEHAVEVVLHRRLGHGLHHHVGALAELLLREARLAHSHQEVVRHHGDAFDGLTRERPLYQIDSFAHFHFLLGGIIPNFLADLQAGST